VTKTFKYKYKQTSSKNFSTSSTSTFTTAMIPSANPDGTSGSSKRDKTWIPEGFLEVDGPDKRIYVVPEFMVPALQQDYNANKKKEDLNAFQASGSVSVVSNKHAGYLITEYAGQLVNRAG
jgi:hypothetical protein